MSFVEKIHTGLFAALCLAAQIVPAFLVRGGSPFLIDQADQIQSGRLLLSGDWRHLYGPHMSDTVPPVRTIGPAGTLMFAVPSYFGGFPAVETAFILLMALAPLLFYFEFRRVHPALSAGWTAVLIFVPHHWFFLTCAWEPLLLLPACLFVLTAFLYFLRRSCLGSLLILLGTTALALHFHLIAFLLTPFAATAFILFLKNGTAQETGRIGQRRILFAGIALIAAAVLPYLIAELLSGSRNYKAVRANLGRWNDWVTGWQTALTVFERLTTIFDAPGIIRWNASPHPAPAWLALPVLFAGSVWIVARPMFLVFRKAAATGPEERRRSNVELLLWLIFALCHVGALLYFTRMSRPYLGDHYAAFLVPLTVFPLSTLVTSIWTMLQRVVRWRGLSLFQYALAWTALALWMGYSFSRFPEKRVANPWNFRAVVHALETACANPDRSVTSFEREGFYSPLPGTRPLLRYTVETNLPDCRWDEHSPWLLHPALAGEHPARLQIDAAFPGYPRGNFKLIRTLPPGIGVYQRESVGAERAH